MIIVDIDIDYRLYLGHGIFHLVAVLFFVKSVLGLRRTCLMLRK